MAEFPEDRFRWRFCKAFGFGLLLFCCSLSGNTVLPVKAGEPDCFRFRLLFTMVATSSSDSSMIAGGLFKIPGVSDVNKFSGKADDSEELRLVTSSEVGSLSEVEICPPPETASSSSKSVAEISASMICPGVISIGIPSPRKTFTISVSMSFTSGSAM